jgi:peptidoglycan/LPS O-acetylase OafA/YrhL
LFDRGVRLAVSPTDGHVVQIVKPSHTPVGVVRRDIQGLRALAVAAVIADHLFHFPAGGFVGVDVFFVISGFIITSLLLREFARTGTISFRRFYIRRVKRILPISTIVIVVTVAASYWVFRPGAALGILTDGVWSLLFAGNWRFASTGTDYWNADGALSPLQHYWSLGVEEQFYFVWPLALLGALVICARLPQQFFRKFGITLLLVTAVCASFIWALHETSQNDTWAYFSTFSRAWELAVGALIAVVAPHMSRIPDVVRPLMAWIGLTGIGISIFALDSTSGIPAPGVLLPVLATALVIVAGTNGPTRFLWPLTNPVSNYVGNLSFSLYLWHFPAIVLLQPSFPEGGRTYYAVVLAITALLAALSYHFVESPIRHSAWLQSGVASRRSAAYMFTAAAAIALTLVITTTAVQPSASPAAAAGSIGKWQDQESLTVAIEAAVVSEDWPELTPSIDSVLSDGAPEEDRAGCSRTVVDDPTSCSFPQSGAVKDAVVLGDSTGITLLPTVRGALGAEYNVRGLTMAACVTLDAEINFEDQETAAACADHKVKSVAEIKRLEPELVFISTMYGYIDNLASGARGEARVDEWQAGTESLIKTLQSSGAQIIVVGSPPLGHSITGCATRTSTPEDCVSNLSAPFPEATRANAAAAENAGAGFIDTRAWFCNDWDLCPSFVETTPLKRDAAHTTRQYAVEVVPLFRSELDRALTVAR